MSWEYSDTEYIKLFRKMVRWEWYTDVNTCHLFIHCLIKANWKDGSWRGVAYKRGQFITSIASLVKETGLSRQSVRTALKHLETTGELTNQCYSNFRLITVVHYDEYQSNQPTNQHTNQPTANQLPTNNQPTANNRYKNNKEDKEDIEENLNTASPESEDEDDWDWDWDKIPDPVPPKKGT